MPQFVTIRSLPPAFEVMKGMQAQSLEWGEGYRPLARATPLGAASVRSVWYHGVMVRGKAP